MPRRWVPKGKTAEHSTTERNDMRAHIAKAHRVVWHAVDNEDPFGQHDGLHAAGDCGHEHLPVPAAFVETPGQTHFADQSMLEVLDEAVLPRVRRLAELALEATQERPELAAPVPWPTAPRGGRKKKNLR